MPDTQPAAAEDPMLKRIAPVLVEPLTRLIDIGDEPSLVEQEYAKFARWLVVRAGVQTDEGLDQLVAALDALAVSRAAAVAAAT